MLFGMVIPGVLVAFLGGLYYMLPRGSGERPAYLATILLTEIMFLVMVTQVVPQARVIPTVGQMFFNQTVLIAIIMIIVLLVDKVENVIKKKIKYLKNKETE